MEVWNMTIAAMITAKVANGTALTTREKFYTTLVTLLATSNPKKKPSMSYDRFQNYFSIDWTKPVTVADCLDNGLRMDDIRHDSAHGFIHLGPDAPSKPGTETFTDGDGI
jgi:hypothetical protein